MLLLAIETSRRAGSIALGRPGAAPRSMPLSPGRRHNVELMVAVDQLFREAGAGPADLGAVAVSAGPGSFTGLRVGMATARALVLATGARAVAVETAHIIARAAPAPEVPGEKLAVALAPKRGEAWGARYTWRGGGWHPDAPPALQPLEALWEASEGPLALALETAKEPLDQPGHVRLLPPEKSAPHATATWHLGRERFAAGELTSPGDLLPRYGRRPEAVEQWERRVSS